MKDQYPNFDSFAPWVRKMLVLKLFSSGSGKSWLDHSLVVHKERRGQLVPSLERDVIAEMRSVWTEKAAPYLEDPSVTEKQKAELRKDLEAVRWAGLCLDRLVEFEQNEEWRISHPEPEPAREVETVAAGNERDPELQFAEVTSQPPAQAEFEVEQPAPPPIAPLSRAQEDSEVPPEPSTEYDQSLFVQNAEGAMRVASFREAAIFLVDRCQAAYERLQTETNVQAAEDIVHAQRLASSWADEIKADQLVRDHLSAILVRSLRRLGQIRADFRKNGALKRGKGGRQLFVGLDKHTLQQSDKLAKIEEDEDFEKRLLQKLKAGELTKYSTLQDPPPPKDQPESALFFRLMGRVCEKWLFYRDGKYAQENSHEWAKCIMGGNREKIRTFATKLVELLGPEN